MPEQEQRQPDQITGQESAERLQPTFEPVGLRASFGSGGEQIVLAHELTAGTYDLSQSIPEIPDAEPDRYVRTKNGLWRIVRDGNTHFLDLEKLRKGEVETYTVGQLQRGLVTRNEPLALTFTNPTRLPNQGEPVQEVLLRASHGAGTLHGRRTSESTTGLILSNPKTYRNTHLRNGKVTV